jgi:outer membrane protein TolC
LIAKRAYDLYSERRYREGSALDDWLDAEREVLSQIPSASQVGNGLA